MISFLFLCVKRINGGRVGGQILRVFDPSDYKLALKDETSANRRKAVSLRSLIWRGAP